MAFDIIHLCCFDREANMFHTFSWISGNRDWHGDFGYMRQRPKRMLELFVSMSGAISCFSNSKKMSDSWSIKRWSLSPVFKCNTVRSR